MNFFPTMGWLRLLAATTTLLGLACHNDTDPPDLQITPATPSPPTSNPEQTDTPAAETRRPIAEPLKVDVTGLTLIDSLDVGHPKSELDHKYEIDKPTFAGAHDYDLTSTRNPGSFRETLRATKSFEAFNLKVSPGREHVLVKGIDTLSRDQSARVLIDGKPVGSDWSMPNGPERYEEASLLIPASVIGAKTEVTVRVEFRSASIDLNSLHYWLYAKPASTASLQ